MPGTVGCSHPDKSIMEMKESDDKNGVGEDADPDERWEDALHLVAETKQASISMVQRRLRIGYNRAARIIEMMEHEGMVAPSDGTSKPREIYLDINQCLPQFPVDVVTLKSSYDIP